MSQPSAARPAARSEPGPTDRSALCRMACRACGIYGRAVAALEGFKAAS